MVWFTERECEPGKEKWYYLLAMVVMIGNISLIMRQLLGVSEISMLGIIIGTIVVVVVLYSFVTFIMRFVTGGCFLINEWWLLLSMANYPFILIINELTYETTSPLAAFPFFFIYPAIAIKAKDREAAIASVAAFASFVAIAFITYFILMSSGWWYYGIRFSGDLGYRIYQYVIGGIYLMATLGVFVAMIPLKIGDFALPGYYAWRYRDTAITSLIIFLFILWLLTYGGVLRTVTNVAYGEYAVV